MKQRQLLFPPVLLLALLAAFAPPPFASCEGQAMASPEWFLPDKVEEKLKKVFLKALKENPKLSIPGIKLRDNASAEEKATIMALAIAKNSNEKVRKWLGENAELLHTIQNVMSEKGDKVAQAKHVQKYLTELAAQVAARLKGEKHVDCEKLKAEGITPEVRLGHSPLKKFGFPVYDSKSGWPLLERRLSLNLINKFPVGITVGAYDYVIQGRLDRIRKFLSCFSIYSVTAETLFPDGHWYSKPHDGQEPRPVYIQLQGVLKGQSLSDILVRHSLVRVLKKLDTLNLSKVKVAQLVDQMLDGDTSAAELVDTFSPMGLLGQVREYAAAEGDAIRRLLTSVAQAKSFKERVKTLLDFLRNVPGGEKWTQPGAVNRKTNLTLTLTTYPRPDSTVRSTRKMDSNRVTLGDVLDALDEINFTD